jgi:hypothetical protein
MRGITKITNESSSILNFQSTNPGMSKYITPMKKPILTTLLLLGVLLVNPGFAPAAGENYDRYAATYASKGAQSSSNPFLEFLTFPFYLFKWPMSKTLVYIEEEHIPKKALWIYEQIKNQGLYPEVGILSIDNFFAGLGVDFAELTRQKSNFPWLVAKGEVEYMNNVYFSLGGELGWQDYSNTGLGIAGIVNYESRSEEDFYGIGPNSSAGDGANYKMETTEVGGVLRYQPHPFFQTKFETTYSNVNITNGEDGGRSQIDQLFPPSSIVGLAGDEMLNLKLEMNRDTRNHKVLSTHGGLYRGGVSFHEGLGSSEAEFFKYYLESSKYLKLGNEKRIFAFHAYGEHNDEINGGKVPFYHMAKLGGLGVSPYHLSHTLRGYDENRFTDESLFVYNAEYRYNIWHYREFRLESVLFWEQGQVFGEFSEFQLDDLKESYGLGFRVNAAHHLLFSVEVAHGDEGTNLYAKTKAPF